jgi:hypothetical protein
MPRSAASSDILEVRRGLFQTGDVSAHRVDQLPAHAAAPAAIGLAQTSLGLAVSEVRGRHQLRFADRRDRRLNGPHQQFVEAARLVDVVVAEVLGLVVRLVEVLDQSSGRELRGQRSWAVSERACHGAQGLQDQATSEVAPCRGLAYDGQEGPAGALVFFTSSSSAGHVALYNGGGKA